MNLNFEFANIVPGGSLTSIYFYNGLNESKLYATSNNYLYSFTPAALCEHNCYNNGVCSKRACTCTGTYTSLRNFTFTYLGPWCGALPCELDASNEYACGYDPNTVACQQTGKFCFRLKLVFSLTNCLCHRHTHYKCYSLVECENAKCFDYTLGNR